MKNIKTMIFTFACMFMLITGVSAKTCTYSNYSDTLSGKSKTEIVYEIDDSGEISISKGLPYKGSHWDKVKSQYASSKTCPPYVFVGNDAMVYLYYDQSSYSSDYKSFGKYNVTLSGNEEDKKEAEKMLKQLSVFCNKVAATKYDYTKCWDEDKITTKYADCKKEAAADGDFIRTTRIQVRGYAQSGDLDPSSKDFTDMEKVCATAEKNNSDYQKAMEYKSCKEYNEAMGTNIKCSTTSKDVRANEYVDKSELDGEDVPASSTAFLEICDAQSSPQTLAVFRFIGKLITLAKIIVPIILIVMGMIELSKAVVSGKDSAVKDAAFAFAKRAMIAVIIFVAPALVFGFFDMVSGWAGVKKKYEMCIKCLNDDSSCPEITIVNNK